MSDESIILEALRRGDEAAYERLVRDYTPRLLAVARRFLPEEADAADAVQDAYLSAFRGLAEFDGQAKLSTWLHRIVVNACLMKMRTRRRRPEKRIDDLLPGFREDGHAIEPPAVWPAAEALAAGEELRAAVHAAIAQLPENYRTVLLLRDIEGVDTAQAAAMLGLEEGAVKTRLHRARQALKTLLDPVVKSHTEVEL